MQFQCLLFNLNLNKIALLVNAREKNIITYFFFFFSKKESGGLNNSLLNLVPDMVRRGPGFRV